MKVEWLAWAVVAVLFGKVLWDGVKKEPCNVCGKRTTGRICKTCDNAGWR